MQYSIMLMRFIWIDCVLLVLFLPRNEFIIWPQVIASAVYVCRQTGNMYKNVKKKIERGVAFPTCISVNNTICHFSPLASDETVLEEGDMIKM